MSVPHLMLALSGHGYGHLAQCAPVVSALREALPGLRLSVCSSLPAAVLESRLPGPFTTIERSLDPVLPMLSAWEVDRERALAVYADFHAGYQTGLLEEGSLLKGLSPDLLLANAPYRVIEAAGRLGIPAVALCSLNWAEVFDCYCAGMPGAERIREQMLRGYRAAETFLTPEPCLPMAGFEHRQRIGPVARTGEARRSELEAALRLDSGVTLVLVALGGIATDLPLECWPHRESTVWLFAEPVQTERDDRVNVAPLGLSLVDIIASVDAVITKPGYGTYAEAVCAGTALLTLERPDWPETAGLNDWAVRHGRHAEISRAAFLGGEFVGALDRLLASPGPGAPPKPTGVQQAAGYLLSRLA
jgi:hypothetical protein